MKGKMAAPHFSTTLEVASRTRIGFQHREWENNPCYDLVFVAENNGKTVGWLAFYEMSDSGIASIWNWHPVVFPSEDENEIANALIQEAFSHLKEINLHKVAIDFQVRVLNLVSPDI
jgi:hypothetical protein